MFVKPLVLNSIIGDEVVPSFSLIYFSDNVCAVECIGKPNSEDEESYWIFYDNLAEATKTFSGIKYGSYKVVGDHKGVLVGPYLFKRIGVYVGESEIGS